MTWSAPACCALFVRTPSPSPAMAAFTVSMSLSAPVAMKARPRSLVPEPSSSPDAPSFLGLCVQAQMRAPAPAAAAAPRRAAVRVAALRFSTVAAAVRVAPGGDQTRLLGPRVRPAQSRPLLLTPLALRGHRTLRLWRRSAASSPSSWAWSWTRCGGGGSALAETRLGAAFWGVQRRQPADGHLLAPRWPRAASSWTWAPTPWTPCVPLPASRASKALQPPPWGFSGSPPVPPAPACLAASPPRRGASGETHGPKGVADAGTGGWSSQLQAPGLVLWSHSPLCLPDPGTADPACRHPTTG